MTWLLTAILCVGAVEAMARLPLMACASGAARSARRATRVLRARHVSDHWKERALRAYSARLFGQTLGIAALLLGVLAAALAFIVALGDRGEAVGELVASWPGIAYSTIVALLYIKLRKLVL